MEYHELNEIFLDKESGKVLKVVEGGICQKCIFNIIDAGCRLDENTICMHTKRRDNKDIIYIKPTKKELFEEIKRLKESILLGEVANKILKNSILEEPEIIQGSDKVMFCELFPNYKRIGLVFNSGNNLLYHDSDNYFNISGSYNSKDWFIPRLKKHIGKLEPGKWYYICYYRDYMLGFEMIDNYHLCITEDKYVYVDGMNILTEKIDLTDMVVYEVIK